MEFYTLTDEIKGRSEEDTNRLLLTESVGADKFASALNSSQKPYRMSFHIQFCFNQCDSMNYLIQIIQGQALLVVIIVISDRITKEDNHSLSYIVIDRSHATRTCSPNRLFEKHLKTC